MTVDFLELRQWCTELGTLQRPTRQGRRAHAPRKGRPEEWLRTRCPGWQVAYSAIPVLPLTRRVILDRTVNLSEPHLENGPCPWEVVREENGHVCSV